MELRALTASDLESLIRLYEQLDKDDFDVSLAKSREIWEEIEGNENIRYFGAVDLGKVVSTCYAVYIPNLTHAGRGICFIENVVTDSEYRKMGLATKVIGMAVQFAKERNCYKVILQSGRARCEAHRFYENVGFNGTSKKEFDMRL